MMRSIIRDLGGKSSTSLRSAQNDTGAPHAISTVGADIIRPPYLLRFLVFREKQSSAVEPEPSPAGEGLEGRELGHRNIP